MRPALMLLVGGVRRCLQLLLPLLATATGTTATVVAPPCSPAGLYYASRDMAARSDPITMDTTNTYEPRHHNALL